MPSSPALRHDGAGRLAPTYVGLRLAEANSGPDVSLADLARAGGRVAVGPASLELRAEAVGDVLQLHPGLSVSAATHVVAMRIGVVWEPPQLPGDRRLRFLQHGWHAEAATGARELDGAGTGLAASQGLPIAEDRADWLSSDLVTVAGIAPGGPACLVGVFENGNAFSRIYLRRDGAQVRFEVELMVDALLVPGCDLEFPTVHLALGTDSSRLLTAYGASFGKRAKARVWRPFLATADLPREELLELDAEALDRQLAARFPPREVLPLDVLVLRDAGCLALADWQNSDVMPLGLSRVAGAIDAAGFIPGVRVAPFRASAAVPSGWRSPGSPEQLDLSVPEVLQDVERQAASLCAAGFRFFEIEGGPEAALAGRGADPRQPAARRLRLALEALRRGAGEEAFLLGVDLPFGVAVGVVDSMRLVPSLCPAGSVGPIVRGGMSRAWMHRRLFLGDASPGGSFETRARSEAEALAAVAVTGGVVSLSSSPSLAEKEARTLLATTILEAQRIDRCGIPGTLRLIEPLASGTAHSFTARDDSGVYRGWVNVGEEGVDRVVEADAELRIGAAGEIAPGRRTIAPSSGAIVHATVPHPVAVFCDFDGTFTVQDVGATLAKRYAPERRNAAWARYQAGEYTPWQYNMEILNDLPIPMHELEDFLRDEIQLDPGARAMLEFCQSQGLPFRILSDGFDWNIGRLQVLHGVSFDYEANRLHYQEGHWRIGPGAPDDSCGCGTGVCKRGVLRRHRLRHPHARLVHIGNGRVSDTCGAVEADQAFAKDSLAPELERRGEPFEPFETLHDVIPKLERMLSSGS